MVFKYQNDRDASLLAALPLGCVEGLRPSGNLALFLSGCARVYGIRRQSRSTAQKPMSLFSN